MRRINGNGNGKGKVPGGSFTTETIDENPYLQGLPDERQQTVGSNGSEALDDAIDDEDSTAEVDDQSKKSRRLVRKLVLAGAAVLLLAVLVCALVLYSRSSTRVDYGQTAKQRGPLPPAPNANATTGRDTRTEQAIEEAQRITAATGQQAAAQTAAHAATNPATATVSNSPTPLKIPTDFGGTVKVTPDATNTKTPVESTGAPEKGSAGSVAATSASEPGERKPLRSQRSQEVSLYMTAPINEAKSLPGTGASTRSNNRTSSVNAIRSALDFVVPSFGSMLPVRTIGALYTLRTGALTRFELTRDMKGNNWSMKRGTILVGTSKGSESDRAFVGIVGFIDPGSGKLVKLGGDVLGGDGGAGLKGKRRQLDGGWTRALGSIGAAALDMTGALIGGRGRDTVVISDGLRTRAINPVTDELSGVIGAEMDRKQRKGFVEVEAGTPGYVMVTDLPAAIKGIEASPDLDAESVATLTDVDTARTATGLSDRELAELLSSGTPQEIRVAIHKMTPEMRKVAEIFLAQ